MSKTDLYKAYLVEATAGEFSLGDAVQGGHLLSRTGCLSLILIPMIFARAAGKGTARGRTDWCWLHRGFCSTARSSHPEWTSCRAVATKQCKHIYLSHLSSALLTSHLSWLPGIGSLVVGGQLGEERGQIFVGLGGQQWGLGCLRFSDEKAVCNSLPQTSLAGHHPAQARVCGWREVWVKGLLKLRLKKTTAVTESTVPRVLIGCFLLSRWPQWSFNASAWAGKG